LATLRLFVFANCLDAQFYGPVISPQAKLFYSRPCCQGDNFRRPIPDRRAEMCANVVRIESGRDRI
jgi:hypothetical protein